MGKETMLGFGIFDHLDDNGLSLGALFEQRLTLVERAEAAGFHAYHLAEHHSTPLGMGAAPSVYLAAVALRTRTLKFGPLVYLLPLRHPMALYQEICALDHLSGGRLQLGVGRGGALLEHQRYGVEQAEAGAMYHEAFAVLMKAFAADVLDYDGRFFKVKDYVITTKPVQRPYPPLWYGCGTPEAADWAASLGINVVSLGAAERAVAIGRSYRARWAADGKDAAALPHVGIKRHVVVAETDAEAVRIARAGYPRWRAAMEYIWQRSNVPFILEDTYPRDWDGMQASGHGIAGSPATVKAAIAALQQQTNVNYLVCQVLFGDVALADASRTVTLMANEVMPAFR